MRSPTPGPDRRVWGWLIGLGLLVMTPGSLPLTPAGPTGPSLSPSIDYVNVTTTSSLSFVPARFSVYPGATVHLVVTQGSSVDHTFTLSPVRNGTIPSSDTTAELDAYFHANPPIVNISLGSSVGARYYRNFTAPAIGAYEFVCLLHFSYGMIGWMTSSPSASVPSSTLSIPPTYVAIAAGVVLAVAGVSVVLLRRRKLRALNRATNRSKKR